MQSSLYVGLSAQLALERRLNTIANNIANQSTPGYRTERVTFSSLVTADQAGSVHFASRGHTHLSVQPGEVSKTGNPLDVAIDGAGWFAVQSKGGISYSRDGRLMLSSGGELQSITGDPILDAGGSSITLNPRGGPISISARGAISQDGVSVGAIGLFVLPANARLVPLSGSVVRSDLPGQAAVDSPDIGVQQGYLEKSNVDAIKEMARLVAIHRSFDGMGSATSQVEATMTEAIRAIV